MERSIKENLEAAGSIRSEQEHEWRHRRIKHQSGALGNQLERIEENCRRMGVDIVTTLAAERVGSLEGESFDLVLADVPCSNSGVLARRPEARWRLDERSLASLVEDQRFLAAAAARFVRPGGRLVYSVCSIEPEESTQLTRRLTRIDPRMTLRREKLILPGGADAPAQWHDGGYYAIFEAG